MATAHRRHALRVAGFACLIVMSAYVVAALILNFIATDHLVSGVDARLKDSLQDARQRTLALPDKGEAGHQADDVDDAPIFLWSVSHAGVVTALTSGAPALPRGAWRDSSRTVQIGTSTFRVQSESTSAGGSLVVGQSLSSTENVQNTFLVAELISGLILAVAIFLGSAIVGIRASAPSEQVRRRQADFTADASHELRTPISVIDAEVSLTLERPRQASEYESALRRIGSESLRLRGIVEDLLWLARADSTRDGHVDGTSTDVALVAEASADRFATLAESRQVAFEFRRADKGPFTIDAPTDWIDRLLGVLVDNACKFAGPDGRATVAVSSTGQKVTLRVEDSGPGIPTEEHDAVFDRFHRASDDVHGTGLGLAIADSVVRATQGTWTIGTSAELGGARMEVSWRRAAG